MTRFICLIAVFAITFRAWGAPPQTFSVGSGAAGSVSAAANWCTASATDRKSGAGSINVPFDMTITGISVSLASITQSGPRQTPFANQSYNMAFTLTGPDGVQRNLVPIYTTSAADYWSNPVTKLEFVPNGGASLIGNTNVYPQTVAGVALAAKSNSTYWASDNLSAYIGTTTKGTWTLSVTSEDNSTDAGNATGCPHTVTVSQWAMNFQGVYGIASAFPLTLFTTAQITPAQTATECITITNSGGRALKILSFRGLSGDTIDYALQQGTVLPVVIAAGGQGTLCITFRPKDVFQRPAQFTVVTDGVDITTTPPSQQSFTVTLQGTAVAPLMTAQSNGSFVGTKVQPPDTLVKYFRIANLGNRSLTVYRFDVNGTPVGPGATIGNFLDPNNNLTTGASDYAIVYPPQLVSGSQWVLSSLQTDSIGILFRPTKEGPRTALLQLRSNAPRWTTASGVVSSDSIAFVLSGVGILPHISATVPNFGNVNQGETRQAQITIKNTGTGVLRFSSQTLVNGDVKQFKIITPFPTIGPDSTGTMTIQLKADSIGYLFATLWLQNNCTDRDSVKLITITGIGRRVAHATITPGELFRPDTVEVNKISKSGCVTLRDLGSAGLVIDSIQLVGRDAVNYSITTPAPFSVDLGTSKNLCFMFRPQVGHPGASVAKAVIYSNNAGGGVDSVSLLGWVCQRSAQARPESLFVNALVDTSDTRLDTAILSNPGSCPSRITSITMEGPDTNLFAIIPPVPTSIASGSVTKIIVSFKADRLMQQYPIAALRVLTDSPIDSSFSIPLRARGCNHSVQANPAPRAALFVSDTTHVGDTSRRSITLKNTGCLPVNIAQALITGPDANEYAVIRVPGADILPGGTDSLVVAIVRATPGTKLAKLTLQMSSLEIPDIVFLLGEPQSSTGHDLAGSVESFELFQNYPNPFNPTTVIRYDVAQRGVVRLEIFNTLGESVGVLEHRVLDAGQYRAVFDAARLPSGSYFCRLSAAGFTQTRVMQLLK